MSARQIQTVLRKELVELLGNRHSARGPLVQAMLMFVVAGIVLPLMGAAAWVAAPMTPVLFFMLPSALAAAIAADSFAGERERKTLETLLATPLADHAIFLGKVGAAVLFAFGVAVVTLVIAFVTVNAVSSSGGLFIPSGELIGGLLGAALSASVATSAIAVGISMRVTVARSAQQMAGMISMAIVGLVAFVVSQAHTPLTWGLVLRIDALVFAIGVVALLQLRLLFRRDRFFESR